MANMSSSPNWSGGLILTDPIPDDCVIVVVASIDRLISLLFVVSLILQADRARVSKLAPSICEICWFNGRH
jgi:hypothetical protein